MRRTVNTPPPPRTYSGNSSRLLNFMTRRGVYIVPWREVIKKEESLREKVLRGKHTLVTVWPLENGNIERGL